MQPGPGGSAFQSLHAHGTLVIAEIGGNHEGDSAYAMRLLELAAGSGADAVKYQAYSADGLVNPSLSPDRHRHFAGFALKPEAYEALAVRAGELGIRFMASVWDRGSLARLDPYISIHKIGSGDFNAYELVEAMVRTGKPIIQSCGLASIDEIEAYVRFVESVDPGYVIERKLCLLQCTVSYPSPDRDANLGAMFQIRQRTGLPVGYSDHTVGTYAAEVAVAMGAEVVELHFTDSREGKTFRDHEISVTQTEMREFVAKVRKIRDLQGAPEKRLAEAEEATDHLISFRRAVYPARPLKAGHVLERSDLISLRPNVGIDAREYFGLVGRRLRVDKEALETFSWDDMEPPSR